MTNETTAKQRPTHRVYAVIKKAGSEKGHWAEIGAAWPHKDGKGLSLKLHLTPIDPNAEIVIRQHTQKGAQS